MKICHARSFFPEIKLLPVSQGAFTLQCLIIYIVWNTGTLENRI